MARVMRLVEYESRGITFRGTVIFASMGKYVTDFLTHFKGPNWRITPLTEPDVVPAVEDAEHELSCVLAVLDANGVPTEDAAGNAFSVHGRVAHAMETK